MISERIIPLFHRPDRRQAIPALELVQRENQRAFHTINLSLFALALTAIGIGVWQKERLTDAVTNTTSSVLVRASETLPPLKVILEDWIRPDDPDTVRDWEVGVDGAIARTRPHSLSDPLLRNGEVVVLTHRFPIRRARVVEGNNPDDPTNPNLRSNWLAVRLRISDSEVYVHANLAREKKTDRQSS